MEGAHHFAERWSLAVNSSLVPLLKPADLGLKFLAPITGRLGNFFWPLAASLLVHLRLATKVTAPDVHTTETAQAMWREADRRGIAMEEIRILGLPRNLFVARYGGKIFSFQGLPRPTRHQPAIFWIDDKAEIKNRFARAGFPVARGGAARSERRALQLFQALSRPVIVKPREGSNGRHTTVHIETEEQLRRAFQNAKCISPWVMIEEELRGPVFRATLVAGKLAAVLRRDPPRVTGDGARSIRELVAAENQNPLRRGPVFAEIRLDTPAVQLELARQGLAPEDVPARGRGILLHFKVNWGVGGTSRDATEETHPENKKLFEQIGAYLGDDIIGIDFMIPDITRSWREQKCGVIECNSLPLIGNHHFPYEGPVKNVAGAVWDMVFDTPSSFL